MGNSCPPCENGSNGSNGPNEPKNAENSTIVISDSCIEKITKEEIPTECIDAPVDDDGWKLKLLCEDQKFATDKGITVENIDRLLNKIEPMIGTFRSIQCPSEDLLHCLTTQKHCIIRCKRYIDEYIDCIDTTRINIMKQKIAEEERCRILEEQNKLATQENELANSFLKVPASG